MKKIKLTRGRFALVDNEDFGWLSDFRWYFKIHHHSQGYAARTDVVTGTRILISMHRLIMKVTDSKVQIDHRNGNKLDNRRSNLRICNGSENNANKPSRSKSGYKGVSLSGNKWRANIDSDHIGSFNTKEAAAIAYNKAAAKRFGEFAFLNQL